METQSQKQTRQSEESSSVGCPQTLAHRARSKRQRDEGRVTPLQTAMQRCPAASPSVPASLLCISQSPISIKGTHKSIRQR